MIHEDRIEWADLFTHPAIHAKTIIDIKDRGFARGFPEGVGGHLDMNAFSWAFSFTDSAGDAANLFERAVMNQERKVPEILGCFFALFRVLDREDPALIALAKVGSHKILECDDHAFENAHAEGHRSVSPSTMSILPRMMMASAIFCPRHISSNTVKLMREGART